jgi:hypothetical protein
VHAADGMSKCPRHLKKSFGYDDSKRLFGETCTSDSKWGCHIITRTEIYVIAFMLKDRKTVYG